MTEPGETAETGGFARRLAGIWAKLLSGSVAAQALNLATLALAARVLPIEILGGIAIIQGLIQTVDGLVNIKSGVPLTKFGADLLARGDRAGFAGLMRTGLLLDAATALLAAGAAAACLAFLPETLGLPAEVAGIAPLYALVVLVTLPGLPMAVLRLFDRYELLALAEVGGAVLRLAAVAAMALAGAGPVAFVMAWILADMAAQLLPVGLALGEMRRRRLRFGEGPGPRTAAARVPGFWGMVWATNATTSIRAVSQYGDVVLVGWLLGPAAAGLFRIGKAAAAPVVQLGFPIQQAAFPELARFWSRGETERFYRHGAYYCAIGAGIGAASLIGAWLAAPLVIRIIATGAHAGAEPVFLAQVLASALYLAGIALLPMASARQRMAGFLAVTAVSAATFLAVAPLALAAVGPAGAALASAAHNAVWLAGAGWIAFSRPRRTAPAGAGRRAPRNGA